MRGTCNDSMNSCGETLEAGASAGGGASVRRSDRKRENKLRWGGGNVIRRGCSENVGCAAVSQGSSQTSLLLGVPVTEAGLGSDEGGYRSNSARSNSAISCREATSPGFLSEYSKQTSCVNGVGAAERSAEHPISEVHNALKHRRSSCSI